jgi:mono/diheme cytochrome c family protein
MNMRRNTTVWSVLGAAAVLVLAARGAEAAAEPGKAVYLRYCSACHGEGGKGDGVVSGFMRPKPTDLTALAKNNKGELPYGSLVQVIDGRQTVRAHGDPDMPVWGEIFKAEAKSPMAREAFVRGKILLIIEYLESVQQK